MSGRVFIGIVVLLVLGAAVTSIVSAVRNSPRGCNGCGRVDGLNHNDWCKGCQRERSEMRDW